MNMPMQRNLFFLLSLGSIGLGCVGLAVRGFALQWQPVPPDLPFQAQLAIACAAFAIGAGLALWSRRLRFAASVALAAYFALWVLLLHVPRVAATPTVVASWLGLAEIAALAAGALAVAGTTRSSPSALLVARCTVGASALVFALAHFVYADFTAAMVPTWLPGPLAWAYATGAGHGAAGLALLTGIRSRLAAVSLAAMCSSFVLLVHVPRVLAEPSSRPEWTALVVAVSIAGAVLAVAAAPERGGTPRFDGARMRRGA